MGCEKVDGATRGRRQGAGRVKHREKTKSRHTSGTRGFRGSREGLGVTMSFYHREIAMFVRISQLPRSISHLVTSGHLRHRAPTRVYVRYVRQSADKEGKALVPTSQAIGLRLQGSTMRGDWLRSMKCQLTIASLRVGRTQSVSIEMLGHNVKATAEPLYTAICLDISVLDMSVNVERVLHFLHCHKLLQQYSDYTMPYTTCQALEKNEKKNTVRARRSNVARRFAHISDSDRDQQFYLHGEIFIITSINFASCLTLFRLAKCVVEHRSDLAPAAVHAIETLVLASFNKNVSEVGTMSWNNQINSQEANAMRVKIETSSTAVHINSSLLTGEDRGGGGGGGGGGGVGVVEGDGTLLATALIIAAGLYRGTCNTTGVFTDRSTGSSCTGGPAACNRRKRARQWLATIINGSVSAHWT
ncbi:hypothetical protein G5I_09433 [Acromyrmex echinatior]|uniref:Uncharacterized protein n=1 Tax=Acromyrmex echinatior TaxID=103372 RepID=F4WU76_ACREC|nr:hypothetical protein G5I_09433 [Acromyrmex echinatior]